jgi:hypothetical protein
MKITGLDNKWLLCWLLFVLASVQPSFRHEKALDIQLAEAGTGCPEEVANKKIAVIVGPTSSIGKEDSELYSQIRNMLERELLALTFELIDQKSLESSLPERQRQLILSGDTVTAVNLGRKLGADLLLIGNVNTRSRRMPGMKTNLKTVHVDLDLKLVHKDSARILSVVGFSKKKAGMDPQEVAIKIMRSNVGDVTDRIFEEYCKQVRALPRKSPGEGVNDAVAGEAEGTFDETGVSEEADNAAESQAPIESSLDDL